MPRLVLSEAQWERLLDAVDDLSSNAASLTNLTTVSNDIHVESLRSNLPKVLDKIRDVVREIAPERAEYI